MRQLPLYDVKNRLSAVVAEVERSGEPVGITRHGRVVACIVAPEAERAHDDLPRVLATLRANADARAKANPVAAEPISWEELKAGMRAGLA